MDKIVLKGYYGFGNFGDDILMVTTYHLVKELFPSHEIIISSESNISSYIPTLLGRPVTVLNSQVPIEAEWIIHGGGGVFFDFKKASAKFRWLNLGIKALGFNWYKKIFRLYQRAKGIKGIKSRFRAGIGIGIGTYTDSSSKFYIDILTLSDFDFLLIRDVESSHHLSRYNFQYATQIATDLAFAKEAWNPNNISRKHTAEKVIGFVLRDWIYDNHRHVHILFKVCLQLYQQGFKLKFFSLDKVADQFFIKLFSDQFTLHIWDPHHTTVAEFTEMISACSMMVSSRAHGAIVSACLGLPVICLAIESKLEKIHEMLSTSSLLVDPTDEKRIIESIHRVLNELPAFQQKTAIDVSRNQALLKNGISIFNEFIQQSSVK